MTLWRFRLVNQNDDDNDEDDDDDDQVRIKWRGHHGEPRAAVLERIIQSVKSNLG